MTRHACFRSLSLGALALTLLLGSCQGAQKATTAEDKHHLQGTEWCDSTGIFTLHFNSPEDVELSLNYEGSPMGTLTYNIPCHFAGDTPEDLVRRVNHVPIALHLMGLCGKGLHDFSKI